MENEKSQNDICCPEFKPEKWDKQTFIWDNKKFVKGSIKTFFHIPFPPTIGKMITKMWGSIESVNAADPNKENTLILFNDPSAFKSDIYISVEKEVPSENNVTISGEFVSMVFDGEYNSIPKFIKLMDKYLSETGKRAKDYYIHYAYCPGCAKKYGHNYLIIFAKI